MQIRNALSGEIIFNQGDIPKNLYIVLDGSLYVTEFTEDGKAVAHDLISKGDCFGEIAIIDQKLRSASILCAENVKLGTISLSFVQDVLLKDINICTNLLLKFSNIIRTNGNETKKLFFQQKFEFPKIFSDGTFFKPGVYLNGGIYNIEKFQNPKNNNFEFNKYRSNFFPQFSVELSKPYYQKNKDYISIITPKILAVKSNKNAFFREIPDESDINNFDFDFIDLFNVNRISGNDRFDSSTRIDYGLSFLKKKIYKDNDITLFHNIYFKRFNSKKIFIAVENEQIRSIPYVSVPMYLEVILTGQGVKAVPGSDAKVTLIRNGKEFIFSANAIPSAIGNPCPKEPVAASIPGINSGFGGCSWKTLPGCPHLSSNFISKKSFSAKT